MTSSLVKKFVLLSTEEQILLDFFRMNNTNCSVCNSKNPTNRKSNMDNHSSLVTNITLGLMNRNKIPFTKNIVGLLDVGITKDNYDEVSKWVERQVTHPIDDEFELKNDLNAKLRNTLPIS